MFVLHGSPKKSPQTCIRYIVFGVDLVGIGLTLFVCKISHELAGRLVLFVYLI